MSIRRMACIVAAALLIMCLTGCMFVKKADQNTAEWIKDGPGAMQEPDEPKETPAVTQAQTEKPETPEKTEEAEAKPTEHTAESGSSASAPSPSPAQTGNGLDSNTQYEANIFLSNFAEQYWQSYDRSAEDFCQWAHFAILFCKINRHGDIEYKTWDGEPHETLTLAQVDSITYRYLGVNFDEEMAKEIDGKDHLRYVDGRIGKEASDGELYNLFAVVDSIKDDGGLKVATFTVYSTDDLNASCYKLTPAQAKADASLTKEATGTAVMKPYTVNGRATYQLLRYDVTHN